MSNSGNPNRYYALDAVRAYTMLLTVVLHAAMNYRDILRSSWPYKDPARSLFFNYLYDFIHSFHMPLFFIIAGFFMAILVEKRGWRDMVKNRFKRILVPMGLAWTVLTPFILLAGAFALWSGGRVSSGALTGNTTGAITFPTEMFLKNLKLQHLWFLYYLFIFYVTALVIEFALRAIPERIKTSAQKKLAALSTSFWGVLVIGLLSFPALIPQSLESGMTKVDLSFIPDFGMYAAFAPFFYFGWFLYTRKDLLENFKTGAWQRFLLGLVFLYINIALSNLNQQDPVLWRQLAAVFASSLVIWYFSFAFLGLALVYANKPSTTTRYLTDASYWIYLVHLPFTVALPPLLKNAPLSAYGKFTIVTSGTVLISLLSYNYLVRNTFVGAILNGKKFPRGLPKPESTTDDSTKETAA